jgi:hypothetical protein
MKVIFKAIKCTKILLTFSWASVQLKIKILSTYSLSVIVAEVY